MGAGGDSVELPVCLNCDGPLPKGEVPVRQLFCSEVCKQSAKTVRYARARRADGTFCQPDIAEAIKIKIGSVLGGGYPESARRLSSAERQAVIDRDGGTCQKCGGTATEVDHLTPQPGTETNDPINLRSLCRDCHVKKTIADSRELATRDEQQMLEQLLWRIDAPEPLRVCDSAEWNARWRGFQRRRKEASRNW